jgi:hypothetical protein
MFAFILFTHLYPSIQQVQIKAVATHKNTCLMDKAVNEKSDVTGGKYKERNININVNAIINHTNGFLY